MPAHSGMNERDKALQGKVAKQVDLMTTTDAQRDDGVAQQFPRDIQGGDSFPAGKPKRDGVQATTGN